MAKQSKLDKKGKEVIKSAYITSHKNISLMCRMLEVDRKTLDKYLDRNPDILLEFEMAEAKYIKQLESTMRQMALGVPEVDEQGRFVKWRIKPNTDVLIKEAEARKRHLGYGKQLDVNMEAKVEGEMNTKVEVSFSLKPLNAGAEKEGE